MNKRLLTWLLVLVVAANAAVILLYSGDGPIPPSRMGGSSWDAVSTAVANLLTVPVATGPNIVDIRDIVLPVAVALAFLIVSLGKALEPTEEGRAIVAFRNPAERWILATGSAVVAVAVFSAVSNQTELSKGWIIRFVAGLAWAALIARLFTPRMVTLAINGLLIVGAAAIGLAIMHRGQLGLEHFTWPIGPITPTAAFAALWAALALGLLGGTINGNWKSIENGFRVVAIVLFVFALLETGRRAPVMGLAAAGGVTAVLFARTHFNPRWVRIIVPIVVVVGGIGGSAYVLSQLKSADRLTSGPLALRFAYWQLAGELIQENPSLGSGPDTFVIEMTNAVAPLRSASPHFYHGTINLYGHNEWIHSAVELGVPGALLYAGLPLGVMTIAVRRIRPRQLEIKVREERLSELMPPPSRTLAVGLVAGITAILVTECASIVLRTAMMPIWLWTLIGLLAALCGERTATDPSTRLRTLPGWMAAAFLIASAAALFAVSINEASASIVSGQRDRFGQPLALLEQPRAPRLYGEKALLDWRLAAAFASSVAEAQPEPRTIADIVARWQELNGVVPGLGDTTARYVSALRLAGKHDEARKVIDDGLRFNPHEPALNVMRALDEKAAPVHRLKALRRALRHRALDEVLSRTLTDLIRHPETLAALRSSLPTARKIAEGRVPATEPRPKAKGEGLVESLRMQAHLAISGNDLPKPIDAQRLAAEYYEYLSTTDVFERRGAEAEADAFFRLADMVLTADPAAYPAAFDAILKAERYAVLGIRHERLANPNPEEGFIGGEVVPTEFPPRLFPLWRLSALLHILAGREKWIEARIGSALPAEQQGNEAIAREYARLSRRAVEILQALPPAARPAHLDGLRERVRAPGPPAAKSEPGDLD